jgi:hypothetical protein
MAPHTPMAKSHKRVYRINRVGTYVDEWNGSDDCYLDCRKHF